MFGNGRADGDGSMKALLGGKGANLAEMSRIGLPVPPGFTITTEVCTYYYANRKTYPKDLRARMEAGVAQIEKIMGTRFGDKKKFPLLVSVRSGARDSMPGMMDTILNLGLNDDTVLALAAATRNERFAWGLLSPVYSDVRRRRHGRAEAAGRGRRAFRSGYPPPEI
jgi:pyruvate,orthophosphate dikinase